MGLWRLVMASIAHPRVWEQDVEEDSGEATEESLTIDCVGHAQLASASLAVGEDGIVRDAENRVVSLAEG